VCDHCAGDVAAGHEAARGTGSRLETTLPGTTLRAHCGHTARIQACRTLAAAGRGDTAGGRRQAQTEVTAMKIKIRKVEKILATMRHRPHF
jgi:hypothetical protein